MTLPFLIGTFSFVLFGAAAHSQGPVARTLATLSRIDANTFWTDLERFRPMAIRPEVKVAVLAALPAEGEIRNLKEPEQYKLAAARQILRLHERDSVYDLKVIEVPYPFVGLHARSVVLISQTALNMMTAEELQAGVAHEAGHEYVWSEFERARDGRDYERLQELEIFCDAVSVTTMRRAGLDPSRLISCIEKFLRYMHEHVGHDENEAFYPTLAERKKFIRSVIKWAARGDLAKVQ
jgi:hypothetical protein